MAELVLMEKGPATMNVPPEKVKQYEEDGWVVIKRPEPLIPLRAENIQPRADIPSAQEVEKSKRSTKKSE